jgi:Methyltransferase domain
MGHDEVVIEAADPANEYESPGQASFADPRAAGRFFVRLVHDWIVATPPPARVLELNCAEGVITEALVRAGYEVLAIEQDPRMVEAATDRIARAGLAADIRLDDATTFEPDEDVDVVLATMRSFFSAMEDAPLAIKRLSVHARAKVIVDLNPRTHPLEDGLHVMRNAGLEHVAWKPVTVPRSRKLNPVGRTALGVATAIPPTRDLLLRRKLRVVIGGAVPGHAPTTASELPGPR